MKNNKNRSLIFLSFLCFTLADVRDGLGPFLGVFLQSKGWTPDQIGYAMTASGLAGMAFSTPAGKLADYIKQKRLTLGFITLGIVVSCGVIFISTKSVLVLSSQILQGALAAAIAPMLMSITLGLVGQQGLPDRLGKNEAWNHCGNCTVALLSGVVGYYYGIPSVFAIMTIMGLATLFCLMGIKSKDIDYSIARGLDSTKPERKTLWHVLLSNYALLAISFTLFFFHLGNAAMLPLLGQSAVERFHVDPAAYTAGTVFIAQITMIAISILASKIAISKGYGILFLLALIILPIRGLIAYFYISSWSFIPVQILDGVGAGLLGVATPGIVAIILKGSGQINTGLGLILTIQGIGSALSTSYAGIVAKYINYSAAFLALSLAPCLGLLLFLIAKKKFSSLKNALEPLDE